MKTGKKSKPLQRKSGEDAEAAAKRKHLKHLKSLLGNGGERAPWKRQSVIFVFFMLFYSGTRDTHLLTILRSITCMSYICC